MTSSLVNDLINNNSEQQAQNRKTTHKDLVKRRNQYLAKKEKTNKLQITLNKLLTPIAQELLSTIIKLSKKQGTFLIKSNFDNKTYKIELRAHLSNR